jgi:hypothetical protein
MFTAIAILAVWTGGGAVMSDIDQRFPFDGYPKDRFQVACKPQDMSRDFCKQTEHDMRSWEH